MPPKLILHSGAVSCAILAAAGPVILHGAPERECNRRAELCPTSYLFSAPDEQAPDSSPALIYASSLAVTGSTVSVSTGLIVAPYRPANWVVDPW